jgi:hypothetical protein
MSVLPPKADIDWRLRNDLGKQKDRLAAASPKCETAD